jgi:SRSO17 transposase
VLLFSTQGGIMAAMAVVDEVAPAEVKRRLEMFAEEILARAMNRPVQVVNGGLYLRGLLEEGARKSLEPMVARLGGEADYQSMQQFLADSPWDPTRVVRAVAERVAPEIDVEAWVLDDTGFPQDGKRSPGVQRQWSGTLGKIGNCQIGVSVHAVGARGTVPLGWALYLPKGWCEDPERRAEAKIPEEVAFKTKPELGVELIERAAGWDIPKAPVLGDSAYAENAGLRKRLHDAGFRYVLAVGRDTNVFAPETVFAPPKRKSKTGRPVPDRDPEQAGALIARIGEQSFQTVTFRDGPDGEPCTSRFVFVRVRAAHSAKESHPANNGQWPPRQEWLLAEWPDGHDQPSEYWISNMPADTPPERLARLARLRRKIELDYKQLKGELGLDHYEGRSWLGWYHHTALVTAAHGFLTLERQRPNHPRPA